MCLQWINDSTLLDGFLVCHVSERAKTSPHCCPRELPAIPLLLTVPLSHFCEDLLSRLSAYMLFHSEGRMAQVSFSWYTTWLWTRVFLREFLTRKKGFNGRTFNPSPEGGSAPRAFVHPTNVPWWMMASFLHGDSHQSQMSFDMEHLPMSGCIDAFVKDSLKIAILLSIEIFGIRSLMNYRKTKSSLLCAAHLMWVLTLLSHF